MRAFETFCCRLGMLAHGRGLRDRLNELWAAAGLKMQAVEYEGKIAVSMTGNTMRKALAAGSRLVDPGALHEPLAYDEESWLHADEVKILAETCECFKRINVTLRALPFGDEMGNVPGTFTFGLQTYLEDADYICRSMLLLGNLTMTLRSLRDQMPCYLTLAIRLGWAYGLFGEDGGEARHHDQHKLTRRRTGGGRVGDNRRERDEETLSYITVMEKARDEAQERDLHETLVRSLGTQEQLVKDGFSSNARLPSWRHSGAPELGIYDDALLPEVLAEAVTERPPKKPKAPVESPARQQVARFGVAWAEIPSPAGSAAESAAAQSDDFFNSLPHSSPAGSKAADSQPVDEAAGEGSAGVCEAVDEGDDHSDGDDQGGAAQVAEVQELTPEDAEQLQDHELARVAEELQDEEELQEAVPKEPPLSLNQLNAVRLGLALFDMKGKREIMVSWARRYIKVQVDELYGNGKEGKYRILIPFNHVCGLGRPPMASVSDVATQGLSAISLNLCRWASIDSWDAEFVKAKKKTKGDWRPADGFGHVTQITIVLSDDAANQLWEKLGIDAIFARYKEQPNTERPLDFDVAMFNENEK
jgi:hypothetical protein